MTPTQQHLNEADRVDLVYMAVLAQIGASTTKEVLTIWQDMPVGQAAQAASSLLARAVHVILTKRDQARDFGLAYYRLARALRTGSTIRNPINEKPEPKAVSLEMLRQEFEAAVATHTGHGSTTIDAGPEPDNEADSVPVEEVKNLDVALSADSKTEEPYTATLLNELTDAAAKKIDGLDPQMTNAAAKAEAHDIHLQHGSMLAAAGARVAINGARNATTQASYRDGRVLGWIRISDGDPCYFCAMLISRGAVYRNEFTAGVGAREDGRTFLGDGLFKYHDNCGCTAEPVYVDSLNWANDPKYAENKYYRELWDRYIKDKFSGDDAINEWRKLITRLRRNKNTTAAQVAA